LLKKEKRNSLKIFFIDFISDSILMMKEHSFYEVNYQFIFLDGEENDENLNDFSK
jgi:hypothetical protein